MVCLLHTFPHQNRSDDQELVRKNLELIISSNNYQLAHEDRELLNSDEMRGVRMLLEINKPEKIQFGKIRPIGTIVLYCLKHLKS